jgi:hypothetical protein
VAGLIVVVVVMVLGAGVVGDIRARVAARIDRLGAWRRDSTNISF